MTAINILFIFLISHFPFQIKRIKYFDDLFLAVDGHHPRTLQAVVAVVEHLDDTSGDLGPQIARARSLGITLVLVLDVQLPLTEEVEETEARPPPDLAAIVGVCLVGGTGTGST